MGHSGIAQDCRTGGARYPLYDGVGSTRRLVDSSNNHTDTYSLDAFGAEFASATGSTHNPYHFGGAWGYITDPSGMLQLGARFYWPEIGRFIQQDPIGDGLNWYAYVGNNPVVWVDPWGLRKEDWFDHLTDFSAGFGDTLSFGLTQQVRRWMGTDEFVDPCSGWYRGGEWTGVAHGFAMGGAGGVRAAGKRIVGKNTYSHLAPARWGRNMPSWLGGPSGRLGRFIQRSDNIWNGNYVSKARHFKHDPYYYPPGWRGMGKRFPPVIQQLDRVPRVYVGTGLGAGWGFGGRAVNHAW